MILLDKGIHLFVDELQLRIMVGQFLHLYHTDHLHLRLAEMRVQYGIAHHIRAGVNT